ncbi:MAG TPA: metalloprotease TldD [Coxiellaceae bacterium]|nr:metalloprotease TldD [Coxiellaceae bacterium]
MKNQTLTPESSLRIASDALLEPDALSPLVLQQALGVALGPRIDYADLFLQHHESEAWMLEEGLVKTGAYSIERGFGIRAISGAKTGFAFAEAVTPDALQRAAKMASSIAALGEPRSVAVDMAKRQHALYPTLNPLTTWKDADKIAFLNSIDTKARAKDPRVKQVMAHLSASYEVVMIYNSEGELTADVRPMVQVSITVLVEHQGRMEKGRGGSGARGSYEFFTPSLCDQWIEKAVQQALVNLEAKPAPAGCFPVILGPGWPGILLHEAVGHGLEGDFNRKKTSAYADKMGKTVASPLCTVVDDATLPGQRGSLGVDDEGILGEKTVLIENGILTGYMQDRLNARLMGTRPTGNGRRESYSCLPMPRMTNTYLEPGQSSLEEMLAEVPRGLYAVDFSGGQVDITSGDFVFSTSEAYWVENGKISHPVKGASLIGSGPEVLKKVTHVGADWALDPGIGTCGKSGQSIPVCVGQPSLLISEITVGGR